MKNWTTHLYLMYTRSTIEYVPYKSIGIAGPWFQLNSRKHNSIVVAITCGYLVGFYGKRNSIIIWYGNY